MVCGAVTLMPFKCLCLCFADPSARQPRNYYELKYKRMAHTQLTEALGKLERLKQETSSAAVDELLRSNNAWALTVGESMLARDQLSAAIKEIEQRGRDNVVIC